MKKLLLLTLIGLVFSGCNDPEIVLVQKGTTEYSIVVPEQCNAQEHCGRANCCVPLAI